MRLSIPGEFQKIPRKWLVAVGCFLMIFLGLGFCSSNKSLYLGAITSAYDIPRSLFSLQDTFRYVTMVLINMFFGPLVAKFGARKLVFAGFVSFCLYLGISTFAQELALFYLAGIFLGLGMSFASTGMVSYLVNQWFPEKRGTVSGAILCANGLGGAIAAQIISPLIDESALGYQNAYRLALVLCIFAGIAVTLLVTEKKGSGQTAVKKKARGRQWAGIPLQQALRKPYFYAALLCVALTGLSLQGIHGIAATHMKDAGTDSTFVATVLSVSSLVLMGAKFLAGFSYDKLGLRTTLIVCQSCGIVAFCCLALCGASSFGSAMAMTYGVLSPLALPLETVIVPLIAADLFGEQDFSKLLGIFIGCNYAGYAVGGIVFNLAYDLTGSYASILIAAAAMMLVIGVVFQLVISAANRTRRQVEAPLTQG